jgi:hypothetical protein
MSKKFVKVSDKDVVIIWACGTADCNRFEDPIKVSPQTIAVWGTPTCDKCGHDLVFSHVEVAQEAQDRITPVFKGEYFDAQLVDETLEVVKQGKLVDGTLFFTKSEAAEMAKELVRILDNARKIQEKT